MVSSRCKEELNKSRQIDEGRILMQENTRMRLVDLPAWMAYTGLGRNTAMKFGESLGCRVRIGRRVLYDLSVADREIDKLHEDKL